MVGEIEQGGGEWKRGARKGESTQAGRQGGNGEDLCLPLTVKPRELVTPEKQGTTELLLPDSEVKEARGAGAAARLPLTESGCRSGAEGVTGGGVGGWGGSAAVRSLAEDVGAQAAWGGGRGHGLGCVLFSPDVAPGMRAALEAYVRDEAEHAASPREASEVCGCASSYQYACCIYVPKVLRARRARL